MLNRISVRICLVSNFHMARDCHLWFPTCFSMGALTFLVCRDFVPLMGRRPGACLLLVMSWIEEEQAMCRVPHAKLPSIAASIGSA